MTGREPGQLQTELDRLLRAYGALLHTPEAEGYQAWSLAEKALNLCGRLREQLDAAAKALETLAELGSETAQEALDRIRSRAALGVVGPPPPDAATEALIRARDEISKVKFNKVAVSDAIWAALDALARLGEARPAEPPDETEA